MRKRIIIIGAGGHGRVIADAIHLQNEYELVGFADAFVVKDTEIFKGKKVLFSQTEIEKATSLADYAIVAIGNNEIRKQVSALIEKSFLPTTIIHPSAVVGADVVIGGGTVVLANAVISHGSKIGSNCIINSGTVIDHDCVVGDNVHLAIGTFVGSNTSIQNDYLSEIGERIVSFSKK